MTDLQDRDARYRRLFGRLTPDEARNLIDRLQVLALTRPDTVRELETFFERDAARGSSSRPASANEDHRADSPAEPFCTNATQPFAAPVRPS